MNNPLIVEWMARMAASTASENGVASAEAQNNGVVTAEEAQANGTVTAEDAIRSNGCVILPFPVKHLPEGFTPEMGDRVEESLRESARQSAEYRAMGLSRVATNDAAFRNGGPDSERILPRTAGEFLRQFHGDGPWPVFSALSKGEADGRRKEAKAAVEAAEGKKGEAIRHAANILRKAQIDCAMWSKNFTQMDSLTDPRSLSVWIRGQEGCKRNIYFSPAVLRPMEKPKKGSKKDVISLRHLWVDIDPHNDIDPMDAAALDPVREAILNLLENLPEGVPLPTLIAVAAFGRSESLSGLSPNPTTQRKVIQRGSNRTSRAAPVSSTPSTMRLPLRT